MEQQVIIMQTNNQRKIEAPRASFTCLTSSRLSLGILRKMIVNEYLTVVKHCDRIGNEINCNSTSKFIKKSAVLSKLGTDPKKHFICQNDSNFSIILCNKI